jgi:protein-disulfide isomerase
MSLTPIVSGKDHVQGNSHAVIELVEYGDYQCPYCGAAYPIVKDIQEEFDSNLKFIFRNFPLEKIHPQAWIAAVATEAAGIQGKFWEMHDVIFEHQSHLTTQDLLKYAQQIGLDVPVFESDLNNETLAKKVDGDFESGIRSGVNRTPGFFINGEKYQGEWDKKTLADYIKQKIEQLADKQPAPL